MTTSSPTGALPDRRPADGLRAVVGALDLLLPLRLAGAELGSLPTRTDVRVYRLLGARQVLQAALTARSGLRVLGVAVDGLHLATMLPLVASRRWRRAALVQSALATLFIVLGVLDDRR